MRVLIMRYLRNILCVTILMVISFLSTQISFAADSEWYWINSDDKYSKYFSTTRINTISSENNIPTCIEDWIKTGYAPGGAAETINNMKLPIKDPNQLSYSLARVQINPQDRTLRYMEEIFYDKDGTALYTLKHAKPINKDINSQSFDEKFYAMIVDKVFNKGEGGRLISNARWLGLWSNASGESSADTATMRQIGNNVIVWIWQENKAGDGNVISIQFMKKEYDLQNLTARTLKYNFWSADTGWIDKTPNLDKNMHSIIPESTEDVEFKKIRYYANKYADWVTRYQINKNISTPVAPTPVAQPTTPVNSTVTSPAANGVANPIGSVGPIGAPIN